MDMPNGKHAELNPRASMAASMRLSVVGDEEGCDVSAPLSPDAALRLSIASLPGPDSTSFALDAREHQIRLQSPSNPDTASRQRPSTAPSRPSSIAKPRLPDSSLPTGLTLRMDPETARAPIAANPTIQVEGPYEGPSGPSHPYQMYPQRPTSISTISASAPGHERSYSGPRGPTHPYTLYPQTTTTGDVGQLATIPVGFPSVSSTYQRRVGPGNEDSSGFVASLAHTEELPPYSRYPVNDFTTKPGDVEQTVAGPAAGDSPAPENNPQVQAQGQAQRQAQGQAQSLPTANASSAVAPIQGAGGIGLATRDPEFSSTSSDLDSPRLSTRSFMSDGSQHEINSAPSEIENEKDSMKSWQKRATKRMWGIVPYWAIGLLAIALVLMGVILGAVIGTFLSKHRKGPPPERPPFADSNFTLGVIPLEAVPPGLPDLEIGEWSLPPFFLASLAPSSCFTIPTQAQAWTCNTPFNTYWMDVEKVSDGLPTSSYKLKFTTSNFNNTWSKYAWGTRPPVIPDHQRLILVNDTRELGWGPAWWLNMTYDKTVVLQEDKFSIPAERSRIFRRNAPSQSGPYPSETTDGVGDRKDKEDPEGKKWPVPGPGSGFPLFPGAKEGDKPWICTWPDIVLEFFLYPGQNNSYNIHPTTTTYPPFTGFPSGFPTGFPTGFATGFPSGFPTGFPVSPTPSALPPDTPTLSGEEAAVAATPSANPSEDKGDKERWAVPKMLPQYPKIIKISERRIPGPTNALASCEQVEVIDGGKDSRPVLDEEGNPVRVIIPEKPAWTPPHPNDRRWLNAADLFTRDTPKENNECGCVWMFE